MSFSPTNLPGDANDRQLIENLRPPAWVNPEPHSRYDLAVIGAGSAGLVIAAGAAGRGAKVALVEKNFIGGESLNFGGVPSKGIIRAGRAIRDARNAAEFGIVNGESLKVDFAAVFERMRQVKAGISARNPVQRFSGSLGIDVFFGVAKFTGKDSLEVEGKALVFHRAAICTGSVPFIPPIPGLEETGYLTNETIFSLPTLPDRLAVIGGGQTGCELAQAFAHLGSTVYILNQASRLLPREDPETSKFIHDALERDGIIIYNDAALIEIENCGLLKNLSFEQQGGSRLAISADGILIASGRIPNTTDLELEQAGVAYDSAAGVRVNSLLQTTNPSIYAAGDVCSPFKFAHAADAMARLVVENILQNAHQSVSALVIPWCTYTTPEAAHVGITQEEAEQKKIDIETLTVFLSEVDRALLDGEEDGFVTVHLKKGSDQILGATIVARNAGEMISEFTLAITAGLGLGAIAATIHPYPTQSEAIKKLADSCQCANRVSKTNNFFSRWLCRIRK